MLVLSVFVSLITYNNSASSLGNMPASNTTAPLPLSSDAPLPTGLNLTLLSCINATIGESVPLLETGSGLTPATIAIIAVASTVGFVLIVYAIVWTTIKFIRRRRYIRVSQNY